MKKYLHGKAICPKTLSFRTNHAKNMDIRTIWKRFVTNVNIKCKYNCNVFSSLAAVCVHGVEVNAYGRDVGVGMPAW